MLIKKFKPVEVRLVGTRKATAEKISLKFYNAVMNIPEYAFIIIRVEREVTLGKYVKKNYSKINFLYLEARLFVLY